jgi:hypothetical protein
MTDKHYSIEIVDREEDKVIRSTTIYQEKVESVGGIGNYVESIDSILHENQTIKISPFWQ